MSSTTQMAPFEVECCEVTAAAIRVRLSHAKAAGILDSYDEDATYVDGKLTVLLLANRMHPSERANFACERLVCERVIQRGLVLHRVTDRPATNEDDH